MAVTLDATNCNPLSLNDYHPMNKPVSPKLSFTCSACKRKLTTPATASGKVVACPCGKKLRVPNALASAPNSIFDSEIPTSPAPAALPSAPYQSPSALPKQAAPAPKSDLGDVKSGQRFLVFSMIGYFCALPVLVSANAFLEGTPEAPVTTVAFGLVLGLGMLIAAAASCGACFGILRMGRVLFPGSTQVIYAAGVLIPAPLIGLLVMFVANSKATAYLNTKGVKVGFFGAKN